MNPYEILGIDKSASQDEIKSAWRKLASKFHPDVNPDPEALNKLQEINSAYEEIKTPEKRASWDSNQNNPFYNQSNSHFDFFRDMFHRQQMSKSLNISMEMTIDEVATGKRVTQTLNIDGEDIEIDFAVPPGVPDMARFNVKQYTTSQGFNVIISVTVHTSQEPTRQRLGNDLLIIHQISAFDAILGSEVEIQGINNARLKLKIPPGTQPDTRLVMRGVGLPVFNQSASGNIIVLIKITIPTDLSQEQKDSIKSMIQHSPLTS